LRLRIDWAIRLYKRLNFNFMNRKNFSLVSIVLILLFCSCKGIFKPSFQKTPAGQTIERNQEWDKVFARKSGWIGGDIAASFVIPGNRVLWVFGDSFIGEVKDNKRVGATMVNNAIAVHPYDESNPGKAPKQEEIKFYWGQTDKAQNPSAWVKPSKTESSNSWYWFTGGGVVFDEPEDEHQLALFLIEMKKKGADKSVWGFECAGSAMVIIANVKEEPEVWTRRIIDLPHIADWGISAFYERTEHYVFIYANKSDENNQRDLILARARPENFENFSQWEFFAGKDKWLNSPSNAIVIIKNISSEMSIDKIPDKTGASHYVMIYSEPFLGNRIFVRTASYPEGPWSEPEPIYRVPDIQNEENHRLFAYASKGHYAISEPGTLLVSYIINSNDFSDLINNASIYQPRFISVPLRLIFIN